MKDSTTVSEWLQKSTGKSADEILLKFFDMEVHKLNKQWKVNQEFFEDADVQAAAYSVYKLLNFTAESVYMGEIGSLLLELRKQ
jgi:hypothetical protein